jgi:bis(5'-nucleosyl)-tetraphosphatase (symmetrical)
VQGCCDQLQQLHRQIEQRHPGARLLFAGDLVNRGPRSLASLRYVRSLGAHADTVLGNHDLHLLAQAHGIGRRGKHDTLDDILQAPDCEEMLDWLRHRPLALLEQGHLLVHAGLYPQWTCEQTLELAREVEQVLQGPNWLDFLRQMYGNTPDAWSGSLQGIDRWRCIVNGLTRMRFCDASGVMDFASKDGLADMPPGFMPWFDAPGRRSAGTTVITGHWSTLGLVLRPDLIAIDTGCVWGGKLTAICLQDRSVLQLDCPQQQKPG